jgi:glutamine amidotransferase-like uncharacterized protein
MIIKHHLNYLAIFWLALAGAIGWGNPALALTGAKVAVYNDSIAPEGWRGVWQDGLTAIESMLTWAGVSYEEVTYNDINNTSNLSSLYKVLIMPGGYASAYNYWISETGKSNIRNFVYDGGGYLGICAGSYFAADKITWYGTTYDGDFMTNAYGQTTGYDLDLFPGTGIGPQDDIANYNLGYYSMATFQFNSSNDVLSGYKSTPYREDLLYYGGPYFSIDSGTTVQTLATYQSNGQPGVVAFNYNSGKVVLFGPHPEIEEDSSRDGTTFGKSLDDNDSDWRLLQYVLAWLGAGPVSTGSGDYSRYDFAFYYGDGSGDYYNGYVYAPTSFQTSSPFMAVGTYIYDQPMTMWSSGLQSLNGGYYYITGVTGGYDSGYDKQSYITSYYDASANATFQINNTTSSLPSYLYGHVHVTDRSQYYEGAYAFTGSGAVVFTVYTRLGTAAAPSAATALTPYQSQAIWGAYWSLTPGLMEE